jgi:hypothetical protein
MYDEELPQKLAKAFHGLACQLNDPQYDLWIVPVSPSLFLYTHAEEAYKHFHSIQLYKMHDALQPNFDLLSEEGLNHFANGHGTELSEACMHEDTSTRLLYLDLDLYGRFEEVLPEIQSAVQRIIGAISN